MEDLSKETEIKCLQLGYEHFPQDVLQAMLTHQPHERLPRRGWISQFYLPVDDPALLEEVVAQLNRHRVPFGTPAEQAALAQVGVAKELRILEKPDYRIYVITIKGQADFQGYSCQQLETPEAASGVVQSLIPRWRTRALAELRKFWYDILEEIDGKVRVIEQDILPHLHYLIVNELEVEGTSQTSAVEELVRLKREQLLPPYFELEVTDIPEMKSRHLAFSTLIQLPELIQQWFSRRTLHDQQLVSQIIQHHRRSV